MMQLVSDDSHPENLSESEPILPQKTDQPSTSGQSSEDTACEIAPLSIGVECASDADESSNLVVEEQPQCRICLDYGGGDIITPCYCKGTQKYVHRSCLDNWRSAKEGYAFSHCTECRAPYILRANIPPDRWWLRLKFQFLVTRDHALIFIVVQLVVACLGLVVYRFYGEELRETFGYEEHPYGFYSMAVVAILLLGLLYGFFIAIICGQRINERHYHVLAKQELTKEYVVESREGDKEQPELDSSHLSELRMMGLY